jgi:hypothetical protein
MGKTRRVVVNYDDKRKGPFPELQIMASYAIGQEWANRLGEKVRLSIEYYWSHPEHGDGEGCESVREFEPALDARTPEPLPKGKLGHEEVEPYLLPIDPSAFWPMSCAFCAATAKKLVGTYEDVCVVHTPVCEEHAPNFLNDSGIWEGLNFSREVIEQWIPPLEIGPLEFSS